jgi:hypothetical protein
MLGNRHHLLLDQEWADCHTGAVARASCSYLWLDSFVEYALGALQYNRWPSQSRYRYRYGNRYGRR